MAPTSPSIVPASRRWLLALLLIGATAIAYLPTLRNGFVWDDDTSLTQNPFVQGGEGLRQFWLTTQTPDYWPVTSTTFWAEWRLWGLNPAGYHATNLSLHLIAALLLWSVLRRLRVPGAYLAALLFALHPVNVESVAWITQRKNLMAMLFFLLSVDCFLRAEEGRRAAYGLSLLAFTLGLLSKGSVAVLPLVLCGIVVYRRRIGPRDLARLAPFFLVAGIFTWVDIWFQGHHLGAAETIRSAGFIERLLGAGAVVWFYLSKALVPLHLVFVYPAWHIAPGNFLWWLPLLGALGLTALLWRMGWRAALFAWGYFCLALLPVMGFTDVYFMKFSLVADHYQHLALIGVTALAGAGWAEWRRRTPGALPVAAAALVAGVLAVLTWRQCLRYRDAETLFEVTLRENPDSPMVHNNLGVILAGGRRLPDALAPVPGGPAPRSRLCRRRAEPGPDLAREGRPAEAIPHYEKAPCGSSRPSRTPRTTWGTRSCGWTGRPRRSPIFPGPSRSIRPTRRPSATSASRSSARIAWPTPSRTTRRPCGSSRTMPRCTSISPTP